MQEKGNVYSDILRSLSSLLAIGLPVVQFLQFWSNNPSHFLKFLGDNTVIFTTSLLALISSIFVLLLFKANPYFTFLAPFQKKQQQKYLDFLKKTDPATHTLEEIEQVKSVPPPKYITEGFITLRSIPMFLLSGFTFVWMGIKFENTSSDLLIIVQALLYTIMIVSAVYILSALTTRLSQQEKWRNSQVDRVKKAINLAKEHDGFENFPKINFMYAKNEFAQGAMFYIVEVSVGDSKYRIVTDQTADILHSVSRINESQLPTTS